MRSRFIPVLLILAFHGCDDHTQQEIDWAKRQAEVAQHKAEQAEQDAKHSQRLREIDKMKSDAEVHAATAESAAWRSMLTGFAILLAVTIVWLARELRLRRILSHILLACKKRTEVKIE